MTRRLRELLIAGSLAFALPASAQHLLWRPEKASHPYTAIYGEVEVLATNQTIYYCGCNWWPGSPAGGYTGIQDPGGGRHNMIFSIWDTSPDLHPSVVQADALTKFNRFGGEGTGAHTHLDYHWSVGQIYRYYATKEQDSTGANTLTKLYFYDEGLKRWVHEATISNPNDGHESVKTFGGMLNAFLENWSGREKAKPKLAVYRLWVGTSPKDLVSVTRATGDGNWGVLDDTFYLAQGDDQALAPVFAATHKQFVRGDAGRKAPLTVRARRIPGQVLHELENLPSAAPVTGDRK